MARSAAPLRFDRNEWAGAFGDIGTDFPLLVGLILTAGLEAGDALILFGLMQLLTGFVYRMPLPVQPLKAMAALVITQKLGGDLLFGAGLAIGLAMLFLTLTGLIGVAARLTPRNVVRGVQFGLGLQLSLLALREYVPAEGGGGYALAIAGFVLTVALLGHRRYPAALFVMALGLIYAAALKLDWGAVAAGAGIHLPQPRLPEAKSVWAGFLVLALPQIPLSLANSILATRQVAEDFFPDRPLSVQRIALTYSVMNLINPFFGGVPTCHGSGGMAGHYAFGGRTGGSVVLYGAIYLILGLFLSGSFAEVIHLFPRPILGVMLLFEGLTMLALVAETAAGPRAEFVVALLVGLACVSLPYGYVIGLGVGMALTGLIRRGWVRLGS